MKRNWIAPLFLMVGVLSFGGDGDNKTIDISDFALKNSENIYFLGQNINNVIQSIDANYDTETIESKTEKKWDFITLDYGIVQFSYTRGWSEVDRIILESDFLETPRGITIGSSIDDVKKAYRGTNFYQNANELSAFFEKVDDAGIIATNYYISFTFTSEQKIRKIELGVAVD